MDQSQSTFSPELIASLDFLIVELESMMTNRSIPFSPIKSMKKNRYESPPLKPKEHIPRGPMHMRQPIFEERAPVTPQKRKRTNNTVCPKAPKKSKVLRA